jgi:hypothetical protein
VPCAQLLNLKVLPAPDSDRRGCRHCHRFGRLRWRMRSRIQATLPAPRIPLKHLLRMNSTTTCERAPFAVLQYAQDCRLEFHGDAVLGLVLADIVQDIYPRLPPGSRTVSMPYTRFMTKTHAEQAIRSYIAHAETIASMWAAHGFDLARSS